MKPTALISTVSLLSFILLAPRLCAQPFHFNWAQHIGGSDTQEGKALCIDYEGNVVAAGAWTGNIDFDPPNMLDTASVNRSSIYLSKYDREGEYLWSKLFPSLGFYPVEVVDVETDGQGNILMTGLYDANFDLDPDPDSEVLTSAGGVEDVFLAKYDGEGNYLWSVQLRSQGAGRNLVRDLEIDTLGNVYVAGAFEQTVNFDPNGSGFEIFGSSNSIFIAKYSADGDFMDMHYTYSPGATDSTPYDIALDGDFNVYLAGDLYSNDFHVDGFNYPNGPNLDGNGFGDILLMKFDAALDPEWWHFFGTQDREIAYAMTIDEQSNIYITGTFESEIDLDPSPDTEWLLTNPEQSWANDLFIAKYSANGDLLWAKEFSGNGTWGKGIDLGPEGLLYVAFQLNAEVALNPGLDSLTVSAPQGGIAIASLDREDGTTLDYEVFDGFAFQMQQAAMDIDASGNFAFTQSFFQPADMDGSEDASYELTSVDGYDAFLVYYSRWPVSVDDIAQGLEYSVYPNPTSNAFAFIEQLPIGARLSLTDPSGRLLHEQLIEDQPVAVPAGLANGSYLLQVLGEKGLVLVEDWILIQR